MKKIEIEIPKELDTVSKANDAMQTCMAKSCSRSKAYKEAKKALDEKYKNMLANLPFQDFTSKSKELLKLKVTEMKSTKEFIDFYSCALQKCNGQIESFKSASIPWLEYQIQESREYIKENKKDKEKKMLVDYHKSTIQQNRTRLRMLKRIKKLPDVPQLIDMLQPV